MTNYALLLAFLATGVLWAAGAGGAATRTTGNAIASAHYRLVVHVNTGGDKHWESVLGNVENVRSALGAASTEIVVVAHGDGLGIAMPGSEERAARMKSLADEGVVFAACENTMKKKNVRREDLLPFATTVDSGVAELVRRQEAGWAYVKP